MNNVLRLKNLDLHVREVCLLRQLNLQVDRGEIAVIAGPHTSDCTYLLHAIAGRYEGFSGELIVNGERRTYTGKAFPDVYLLRHTRKYVSTLSVMENIYLLTEDLPPFARAPLLRHKKMAEQTDRLLREFDLDLAANALVRETESVLICKLELLKAYAHGVDLIVLEPFIDLLQPKERTELIELILKLKARGMSFLFMSNMKNLDDYRPDRVALLRDRTIIYTFSAEEYRANAASLYADTASASPVSASRPRTVSAETVFAFSHVRAAHLHDLDFRIHRGEIVGLICSGYSTNMELIRILRGDATEYTGLMSLEGRPYQPTSPEYATQRRILFFERLFPESAALYKDLPLVDNIALPSFSHIMRGPFINPEVISYLHEKVSDIIGERGKPGQPLSDYPALDIRQKNRILIERWSSFPVRLLVVSLQEWFFTEEERERILRIIRKKAAEGMACLILSWRSEDFEICDTVYTTNS